MVCVDAATTAPAARKGAHGTWQRARAVHALMHLMRAAAGRHSASSTAGSCIIRLSCPCDAQTAELGRSRAARAADGCPAPLMVLLAGASAAADASAAPC